jgi:hypothetical protein
VTGRDYLREDKTMISRTIVETVDQWLDDYAADNYQTQPMAQDWARVAKVSEELGEAIAELISWTGQNPRKGMDALARRRLLAELADTAMTSVYAIQHFTKDVTITAGIMREAGLKHMSRVVTPPP